MDISANQGLSSAEIASRVAKFGLNILPAGKPTPAPLIFLKQFRSFLTLLLFLASVISFFTGDTLDGVLILLIILLNATIGFFQEFKAKRDVEALTKMVKATCRVIRDGQEKEMETKFLVPGDVVILGTGDKVPADGKVLVSSGVSVDESALSGESVPVIKDNSGLIYMGTTVLKGRVTMEVSEIGLATRFGQIAQNLKEIVDEKTPLEIKVADLSQKLGIAAMVLIGLVMAIGFVQGRNPLDMFFSGVALAVAAVPEGLPSVLTIALAVGVRRLAKRKAIVKRLVSTETLGSVDVIVSDKTGTLTKNEMTVKKILTMAGEEFDVSGAGYNSTGQILPHNPAYDRKTLEQMLRVCILCNGSSLVVEHSDAGGNHGKEFKVLGDTTEGALLVLSKKAGWDFERTRRENPILEELPFDSETRMMAVVIGSEVLVKGAPETIVSRSANLTPEQKKHLLDQAFNLAGSGMRLVALANKQLPKTWGKTDLEREWDYLGLVAIYDPPRPEVKEAIAACKGAGIHVVMATGDFAETARAVAHEIGLIEAGEEVVTGDQLATYSDEVLKQNLLNIRVFARVSPGDKLRIVEAFQALGRIVAVTGDGVNDAPALKRAQVGVAMGISGVDVAKEAADLIITDDNFVTIVAAVEEGRVIFANLVKAIKFLLASNLGEVLAVSGALLLGLPLPLSPLALLWINVASDGLPALALAIDAKDGEILRKSSHELDAHRKILGRESLIFMLTVGTIVGSVALLVFWLVLPQGVEVARIATFTAVVGLDLLVAFVARGRKQNIFSNKLLLLSVAVTVLIQLAIIFIPQLREIFV